MNFDTWSPVYEAILEDFGFDRTADERARDALETRTQPFDWDHLGALAGAHVAVVGAAPSLETEASLERLRRAGTDAIVAASSAVDVLEDHGFEVDCMVTDLDKNPDTVVQLTERGTPVAVHAHGDNVPMVKAVVVDCRGACVLPTTQAEPVGSVVNVGGFTDGDRAAFLADHCGADRLTFVGWDFDDPTVDPMKAKKLTWAERLLYWLERRRGEQFGVLDGRRDPIDTTALPVE